MAKKANGRGGRKIKPLGAERTYPKAMGPKTARAMATHFPGHKSAKPRKGGKPKPPADPMDREVPVKLGPDAIKIREHELAEKVLLRNRLVAELRDTAKAKRGEIETLTARINELAQVCTDGVDNVRQGDLRFGEGAADAAQVLGKTAKTIEEAALEKGALTEAMDAVEADMAAAGLPSEPHMFAGTGGAAGVCGKCGSVETDPVHRHEFVQPMLEGETKCSKCAADEMDPVHQLEVAEPDPGVGGKARSKRAQVQP